MTFSLRGIFFKAWTDKFRIASLLQNDCVCAFHSAPRLDGRCEFVSSTSRSLTFSLIHPAQSATRYELVGHSRSASTNTTRITVSGLTPGSHYTFTVWAVGWQGLRSNNITCTNSTGLSEFSLCFWVIVSCIFNSSFNTNIIFHPVAYRMAIDYHIKWSSGSRVW